jgi:hypothetical protein
MTEFNYGEPETGRFSSGQSNLSTFQADVTEAMRVSLHWRLEPLEVSKIEYSTVDGDVYAIAHTIHEGDMRFVWEGPDRVHPPETDVLRGGYWRRTIMVH